MKVLRTPEIRFTDLPDVPFEPRYHQVTPELRLHYVDEGPGDARACPSLVPMEADIPDVAENKRAWEVLGQWHKPFICCFSNGDPITRGGDAQFLSRVPGIKGQAHTTLRGGHFIQEDDPQNFARLAMEACGLQAGADV